MLSIRIRQTCRTSTMVASAPDVWEARSGRAIQESTSAQHVPDEAKQQQKPLRVNRRLGLSELLREGVNPSSEILSVGGSASCGRAQPPHCLRIALGIIGDCAVALNGASADSPRCQD